MVFNSDSFVVWTPLGLSIVVILPVTVSISARFCAQLEKSRRLIARRRGFTRRRRFAQRSHFARPVVRVSLRF